MPSRRKLAAMWANTWGVTFDSVPELEHLPRLNFVRRHLIYEIPYTSLERDLLNAPFFKFTISGEGLLHIGQACIPVGKNRGFLYDPKRTDCYFEHPSDAEEPWEWFHISFLGADELVREIIETHGFVYDMEFDHPLLEVFRAFKQGNQIESMLMISAAESSRMVVTFLADLVKLQRGSTRRSRSLSLVQQARGLICTRLNERPAIRDIADEMRISVEHLIRVFKRETGLTPLQYYQQEAIARAKVLLHNPNRSVKEVAAMLNFKSCSHFISFFRKRTGYSPAAYREAHPLGGGRKVG